MSESRDYLDNEPAIKPVTVFECPICHRISGHFKRFTTQEMVQEHFAQELAWQKLHRNTVEGTILKVQHKVGEILALYTVSSVRIDENSMCGNRFQISIREYNNYYTAASLYELIPATEEEINHFIEKRNRERKAELEQELATLG